MKTYLRSGRVEEYSYFLDDNDFFGMGYKVQKARGGEKDFSENESLPMYISQ